MDLLSSIQFIFKSSETVIFDNPEHDFLPYLLQMKDDHGTQP